MCPQSSIKHLPKLITSILTSFQCELHRLKTLVWIINLLNTLFLAYNIQFFVWIIKTSIQ
jgi:hypothetical protein